jgi:hypothetical protein
VRGDGGRWEEMERRWVGEDWTEKRGRGRTVRGDGGRWEEMERRWVGEDWTERRGRGRKGRGWAYDVILPPCTRSGVTSESESTAAPRPVLATLASKGNSIEPVLYTATVLGCFGVSMTAFTGRRIESSVYLRRDERCVMEEAGDEKWGET